MQYQQKIKAYKNEKPLYIADFLKYFIFPIGHFD
jgi:hypothetical protein